VLQPTGRANPDLCDGHAKTVNRGYVVTLANWTRDWRHLAPDICRCGTPDGMAQASPVCAMPRFGTPPHPHARRP